jgi:excisionase family DNA binding protein
MTPPEAAVYTGTSLPTVIQALLARELVGTPPPGGALRDSLLAREDLDLWVEREQPNDRLAW